MTISRRKLSWNAELYHRCVGHALNFVEKTFVGGSKSAKFVNVSSSKVFHCTVPYSGKFSRGPTFPVFMDDRLTVKI